MELGRCGVEKVLKLVTDNTPLFDFRRATWLAVNLDENPGNTAVKISVKFVPRLTSREMNLARFVLGLRRTTYVVFFVAAVAGPIDPKIAARQTTSAARVRLSALLFNILNLL